MEAALLRSKPKNAEGKQELTEKNLHLPSHVADLFDTSFTYIVLASQLVALLSSVKLVIPTIYHPETLPEDCMPGI